MHPQKDFSLSTFTKTTTTTWHRPVRYFSISKTCNLVVLSSTTKLFNVTINDQQWSMISIITRPATGPAHLAVLSSTKRLFSPEWASVSERLILQPALSSLSLLSAKSAAFSYELLQYDRPWLLHGRMESSKSPFSIRLRFSKLPLLPPPSPPKAKVNQFDFNQGNILFKGESIESWRRVRVVRNGKGFLPCAAVCRCATKLGVPLETPAWFLWHQFESEVSMFKHTC